MTVPNDCPGSDVMSMLDSFFKLRLFCWIGSSGVLVARFGSHQHNVMSLLRNERDCIICGLALGSRARA